MASFTPVLGDLAGITSAISTVNNFVGAVSGLAGTNSDEQYRRDLRAQQNLALAQLQQKQALDMRDAAERANLTRAEMAAEAQASENARRDALKRAVARQRASFGAQGIGGAEGSSEAVLLGMFEESDEQRAERERMDNIRLSALDQDITMRGSINMLERTQLMQRQKLERQLAGY